QSSGDAKAAMNEDKEREEGMWARLFLCAVLVAIAGQAGAAERMRFWNLTTVTISQLYLAPAGTTQWGPNQCKNDKDGTVDSDERLNLVGITPGKYHAKWVKNNARTSPVDTGGFVGAKP